MAYNSQGKAPVLDAAAPFAEVTAVQQVGAGRFVAELHPEWSIGGKPNGGYLLAVLGRAATEVARHPVVTAASAHFLRPASPGEAVAEVEVLREGRSVSHLRARLVQDGHACLEAMFTVGEMAEAGEPDWQGSLPEPASTSFDDSVRLSPDPEVFPVPLLGQVDLRLDPPSTAWTRGTPTGRGELHGWLALPGDQRFDPVSLLFAVDAFPPATFDVRMTGWVPTLQLSVYVRAMPVPGPVRVLQQARLVADQRLDEACTVWDTAGRLVAQATQLAAIRLG